MIQNGIYVTMITPYLKNGEIDYVPLSKAIKEKKDINDDKWNALQVLSI